MSQDVGEMLMKCRRNVTRCWKNKNLKGFKNLNGFKDFPEILSNKTTEFLKNSQSTLNVVTY
jgi:hypothetical protein